MVATASNFVARALANLRRERGEDAFGGLVLRKVDMNPAGR